MPDLDGFNFLRAMRTDPVLSSVPVVVLTCRSRERDFVQGLQLGAVEYVSKPFDPEELVARVRDLLRMSADDRQRHREVNLERALVLQQIEDAFD